MDIYSMIQGFFLITLAMDLNVKIIWIGEIFMQIK